MVMPASACAQVRRRQLSALPVSCFQRRMLTGTSSSGTAPGPVQLDALGDAEGVHDRLHTRDLRIAELEQQVRKGSSFWRQGSSFWPTAHAVDVKRPA